ncbi:MAG: hypothetical protein P8J20_12795 [Novosphingobium sp.]|nr:hypothetical protein [Novosphingobium sp.]
MPETDTIQEPQPATPAIRGTLHKFLPLPVMPQHAKWFEAGPVTMALELRVLDDGQGRPGERSISIHVFDAARTRECVRFDCFDRFPHYHYILNKAQNNIVWGYDTDANGPMLDWSFDAIRNRLPAFLRRAGEDQLADEVEREGLDTSVVDRIRRAIDDWEPSLPSEDAMAEAMDWYRQWKKAHPQFNTAAGQEFL